MELTLCTAPNLTLLPMSSPIGNHNDLISLYFLYAYMYISCMNRYHGDTRHNLIVANQNSYTLNNVSAPVLYKLIHYFMENPINGETVLKYPIEEREVILCAACKRKLVNQIPFYSRHLIVFTVSLVMHPPVNLAP